MAGTSGGTSSPVALNHQGHSGCGSGDGQQCPGTNRGILTHRELWLWLLDHGVLGRGLGGKATKFLFDTYK